MEAAGKLQGGISQKTGEALDKGTVLEALSCSPPLEEEVATPEEKIRIVDKPTGLSKVKKFPSRNNFNPLHGNRRLWYRVKRKESPGNILALASKTYKVYADIGPTVGLMSPILYVSSNGAGQNPVRKSKLPPGI